MFFSKYLIASFSCKANKRARPLRCLLAAICGSLLLGLTGWVLWQRRKIDPAQRIWQRFTAKLAKKGVHWNVWEGPRDFAQRAAASLPAERDAIHAIAAAYAAFRYGHAPTRDDLDKLTREVRRFSP